MRTECTPNTPFVCIDCSQRPPTGQVRLCWRPTTSVWMQARLGKPVRRCNTPSRHTVNVHSVTGLLGAGARCALNAGMLFTPLQSGGLTAQRRPKVGMSYTPHVGCYNMRTFKGSGRCEQSTPSRHRAECGQLFTATAHRPGSPLLASPNLGVGAGQVGGACAQAQHTPKTHCERSQRNRASWCTPLGAPRTQVCCSHLFKAAASRLKGDQKLA